MTKTYSEDFENIFRFTVRISKISGVDVIKKNLKINWKTAFVFAFVNLSIICSFYTNYRDVLVKENPFNLFKSNSVVGSGFQVSRKFLIIINIFQNSKLFFNCRPMANL